MWRVNGFVILIMTLVLPALARAQVTVESLTGSAVNEVGPYYQDVEDAINRFFSRDLEGARALLTAAKKKSPKLAPPEVMLAQLLMATGQIPAARIELERAVRKSPDDPEAYLILADGALGDSRPTEAGLLYAKAAALAAKFDENPKRKQTFQTRSFTGMATIDESRENWPGAKESLQAWVKLDPNNAAAHQRLARVLFQLGEKKEAYAEFQATVKADPKFPPADVSMANLYAAAGDKTQAEKFMTAAAKRGGKDLSVNLALVPWYLQRQQFSEAQAAADAALKLDPNNLEAKTLRGIVARWQRDYPTAQKWLEAAHTQSPSNASVNNQLALVLVDLKGEANQRRALEFAEINQKLNPNNPEIASTLGWVAYRMGRKADALRILQAAFSTGNFTPDGAYYMANLLKDQGQTGNATKLLDTALSNDHAFAYREEAEALLAELRKKRSNVTPAEEAKSEEEPTNDGPKKEDSK